MKKQLLMLAFAGLSAAIAVGAPTMHPYELPASAASRDQAMHCLKADEILAAGGKLELGKWYTDWASCKQYCDDNGIPMLAIWSNAKCVHCWYTDICFQEDTFKDWASTHDAGKVIYCFMAGGESGCPDQSGSVGYNWMYYAGGSPKLKAYPFVVLWWKEKGINYRATGDNFCASASGTVQSLSDASVPTRIENIIAKMETQFADWHPEPEVTYAGGYFTQTNYPYASLQAESTTKNVAVEMVRESMVATNQTMTIAAPGKTAATVTINWALGQTVQTNVIANFNTKWFVKGQDVTVTLKDGENEMSTVKIACVETENSAGNPKWIGKTFDFGEWTMDLDAAKTKVLQTSGKAYTLVSLQGSLWCPDCANVERNFLDVEDTQGNNRFAAWARSKNVALVSVDIPNFNGPNETDYATPCLLSRTAYQTTLARAKEYPQSGADASLTNKMWRSGLGYLTRNEISDADAAAVFSRNHDLAKKNTYEGGFHRPEDANANRTGVPIFVLLRKNGEVAARLTRMASVSPMSADQANFDNYIKRLEEMMTIADENATEIENNYASASNQLTLKANGGSESATLSHADATDVFRLEGVGGNALQSIKVSGSSEAEVIVSLVTTNAAGKAETLVSSDTRRICDEVTVEYTFDRAGSYFVEVKAADIASDEFKVESANSTFQSYTVTGSVVLVPQEDCATARPAAGNDWVTIKLVDGTRYYITGMSTCPSLLPVQGAPAGFYVATSSGNAKLTLTEVDGEVSYQTWVSSTVGFDETERTVSESVCDLDGLPLEIEVTRQGGKSGWVKMTVSVDTNATTLSSSRYSLVDANEKGAVEVTWADGDTQSKRIKLYIDDAIGEYDGTTTVMLSAQVSSQIGDATLVTGKENFELTVVEDDKQDPGTAYIMGAEPSFVRTCTVYARQTEGAKLWATRVDGSDGLVAAAIRSTSKETVFQTENARDLESLADVAPEVAEAYPEWKDAQVLYWSSRERGKKSIRVSGIPAGKTAKVVFQPVNLAGITASNTVTIVSVADDAPGFAAETSELSLVRCVETTSDIGITNLVADSEVSLKKIGGRLPAGLKVKFIRGTALKTIGFMSFSGATTAKAGTYEAIYRVSEKRGNTTVDGLVTRVVFTIEDPISNGVPGYAEPNPDMLKSRTFKDIPVLSKDGTRLMGLLQLTMTGNGRVSAKFNGIDGTVSYSSKAWNGWTLQNDTPAYTAQLVSNKGTDTWMGLQAYLDGSFAAQIFTTGADEYTAVCDGKNWSKKDSATDWKGYYTVALRHHAVLSEDQEGVAPTGDGYLTLKMSTTTACNKGTFTLAGRLPNGTKFSGSAQLCRNDDDGYLPVVKKSSRDALSVLLSLAANAQVQTNRQCVASPDGSYGYWAHTERAALKGSFATDFTAHGSYYDTDESLSQCCEEYYETREMNFYVDGSKTSGASVTVESDTVTIPAGASNTYNVSLTFNRRTGVITGTFQHPTINNSKMSYTGIVVNGWGEGCGCGPGGGVFLPFMSGSYFYSNSGLTRGGSASIDK